MFPSSSPKTELESDIFTVNKKYETEEKAVSSIFKKITHETSVYRYYVELKENSLTEKGFFDLTKVPNLRVSGAGQFLKKIRIKNHLTQSDFAKILNASRNQVNQWENNYRSLPLKLLVKIAEKSGISRDSLYSLIDQGKFSSKTILPVKLEKISNIVQYLSPNKTSVNWNVSILKCSKETLSQIKAILNVKPHSRSFGESIYSKELFNYLQTFFLYTKAPKIHPPLTSEVKLWHDECIDLKRAIICPCLQSDGCIDQQKYKLRFHGKNEILHNYFVDAMFYEYNVLPSSYLVNISCVKQCYETKYRGTEAEEIVKEVVNLSGSTKTSPSNNQSVDEYLEEPQPQLNYLQNALEIEQKIAFRIWSSADGFVSITRRDGYIHPVIGISCAHPDLAIQLKEIAQEYGIFFTLQSSKRNWSGVLALSNATTSGCINFIKLGGFIKGVKIGANSKYHKDIFKDILTLGILEFIRIERVNQKFRKLSIKEVHHEINKIIKNKEYKSVSYYIDFFS